MASRPSVHDPGALAQGSIGVSQPTYSPEQDAPDQGLSYVPYLEPRRFPGTELVSAAASLLPPESRRRRDGGIRFRIRVGPGVVAFAEHGLRSPQADPVERGEVLAWSAKSRTRMIARLASLDYGPLFAEGRTAAMVTLTLPGDWLTVAPTGREFKRLMQGWIKRYEKVWGPLLCIWKLEFQSRGAPHLHLFMAPPHGVRLCRCRTCGRPGERLGFKAWLSHSWADVVGHPVEDEYRKHLLAGTGIDYREGTKATDPKRLAVYFGKHGGAGGGKEYQHQVPAEWQGEGNGPGRFWGVRRLEAVLIGADVPADRWYAYRRVVRRWSARQAFYPTGSRYPARVELRTRERMVARGELVDPVTGEARTRKRKVTRRRAYLAGAGGGFVLPNDGPAFVSALVRLP